MWERDVIRLWLEYLFPHEPKPSVIPSGAPKARSRGIAGVPKEGRVPLRAWLRFLDFAASRLRSE